MTTAVFLGVDLGWFGKPTGLASISFDSGTLSLTSLARIEDSREILDWIEHAAGDAASVVAAVDAPLVIPNATGIRAGERELNAEFRRYHAGCHPANLGRPFASYVTGFSRALEASGFLHGAAMEARAKGRFQIEAHPHAATVRLFGLDRIVKYKRGLRADRAKELQRLRDLVRTLPVEGLDKLPAVPETGPLKPAEDQIDAALCAYIAAHWWFWGKARSRVFGSAEDGYVIVPDSAMLGRGVIIS